VQRIFLWFPVRTFDGVISGMSADYLQCIKIVVNIYLANENGYIFCQKNPILSISLILTRIMNFSIFPLNTLITCILSSIIAFS